MQAISNKTNDLAGHQLSAISYQLSASRFTFRAFVRRQSTRGLALTITILAALLAQPLQASAYAPFPAIEMYLAPTGQTIQGGFLQAFQKYGLALIGYPLTSELNEGGRTVQYFERVKMEYHPELAAAGTRVLFTRLGANISAGSSFAGVAPFQGTSSRDYFAQTSHSLGGPFLSFWLNNGGLALFGYPISEVIQQDGMQVQWFERARMEYHPELASKGYGVELTLLGRIAYGSSYKQSVQFSNTALVTLNSLEASLLAGINAQRASAGVSPVSLNSDLAGFAHWRSSDMASRGYFSHTTPEDKNAMQLLSDRGIAYSLAGEILAKNNYDQAGAVKEAISSFLQSAPHRSIMLDGRYTQVGVGFAVGSDGMNYFTAVFIRR